MLVHQRVTYERDGDCSIATLNDQRDPKISKGYLLMQGKGGKSINQLFLDLFNQLETWSILPKEPIPQPLWYQNEVLRNPLTFDLCCQLILFATLGVSTRGISESVADLLNLVGLRPFPYSSQCGIINHEVHFIFHKNQMEDIRIDHVLHMNHNPD